MADEWDDFGDDQGKTFSSKPANTNNSQKNRKEDASGWDEPDNKQPRQADPWDDAPQSDQQSSRGNSKWNGGGGGGGGGDRGDDRKKNDWKCPDCGNSNYGWRTECQKCSTSKPGGGGSSDSRPPRQKRDDDWDCPDSSCGNNNFGFRKECQKCQTPKPESANSNSNGYRRDDSGGGRQKRGDEWICPDSSCGNNNFAFRKECQKCQTPKPESANSNSNGFRRDDSGGGRQKRGDEWVCPDSSCGNNNFAFRKECQKCQTPKPEGEKKADEEGFQSEQPKEFYIPPEADVDDLYKSCISSGINFDKYKEIPVKVTGDRAPPPCRDFQSAGLNTFVLENINKCNYTTPTPIQKHAIPIIMAGRDIMACAQTGSGKTAAFLLPIINILLKESPDMSVGRPHAIIVSPTRELAIQIYDEARKFARESFLKISIVYGGTATRHQSTNIAKGCHILVATPGRLMDFVDKAFITFEDIRFVVLDEADRMLDLGFLQTVEKLMDHQTMVETGKRQTLMFSATFPKEIQQLAGKFLKDYLFIAVGIIGGACTDVEQNFFEVTKFDKRNKLMEILDSGDPKGTIVFVETKRNADFLASFLSESKHPTTSIHGDRLQRQREEALRDFKYNKMKVLIATSVAARGLDIPNVHHVINYDLPKSIEDYVHRIGRTGRVGNRGKATSFYNPEDDSALASDLVRIIEQTEQAVPEFLSNYAGAGGGSSNNKSFGGKDYRSNGGASSSAPAAHGGGGEDEEW